MIANDGTNHCITLRGVLKQTAKESLYCGIRRPLTSQADGSAASVNAAASAVEASHSVVVRQLLLSYVGEYTAKDLWREISLRSLIAHPNILHLYSALAHGSPSTSHDEPSSSRSSAADGTVASITLSEEPSILMVEEDVSGCSIAKYLRRVCAPAGRGLSAKQVAVIAFDVLTALVYLHDECHIIHHEISLQNLLLESTKGHVKLSGFRSAVSTTGVQGQCFCHGSRTSCRIPEMNIGRRSNAYHLTDGHGYAVDVYAFGMCVIEMCFGLPQAQIGVLPRLLEELRDGWVAGISEAECALSHLKDPLLVDFVSCCVRRKPRTRSTARDVLTHPFIVKSKMHIVRERSRIMGSILEGLQRVSSASASNNSSFRGTSGDSADPMSMQSSEPCELSVERQFRMKRRTQDKLHSTLPPQCEAPSIVSEPLPSVIPPSLVDMAVAGPPPATTPPAMTSERSFVDAVVAPATLECQRAMQRLARISRRLDADHLPDGLRTMAESSTLPYTMDELRRQTAAFGENVPPLFDELLRRFQVLQAASPEFIAAFGNTFVADLLTNTDSLEHYQQSSQFFRQVMAETPHTLPPKNRPLVKTNSFVLGASISSIPIGRPTPLSMSQERTLNNTAVVSRVMWDQQEAEGGSRLQQWLAPPRVPVREALVVGEEGSTTSSLCHGMYLKWLKSSAGNQR